MLGMCSIRKVALLHQETSADHEDEQHYGNDVTHKNIPVSMEVKGVSVLIMVVAVSPCHGYALHTIQPQSVTQCCVSTKQPFACKKLPPFTSSRRDTFAQYDEEDHRCRISA